MASIAAARSKLFISILLLSTVLFPTACSWEPSALDKIRDRGQLRIATRNAPTTYYERHDELFAGLEYELASEFALYLGVEPQFIVKRTIGDILASVSSGESDVGAAGLTPTPERRRAYLFGPTYQEVEQQLVCRRNNGSLPPSIAELGSIKVTIPVNTSYEESLHNLQLKHTDLNWEVHPDWDTEILLAKVWQRELDCTVADSNIFIINQRYMPELVSPFAVSEKQALAWAMDMGNDELLRSVNKWFTTFKADGQLDTLLERYYGFLDGFDYVDTRKFQKRIKRVLPLYRQWFEQAAQENDLDWLLLAAQAYQESHWNPRARSKTGVRGIMMLTLPTARQLGVTSRLDARSNIFAGATYLARLRKQLPERVQEPERSWMALAAYNLGYGHLSDARKLAEKLDKDPDQWQELEQVLPLLSSKTHYQTLKHGYARGGEAVNYVRQIRDYRDILTRDMTQTQQTPEK